MAERQVSIGGTTYRLPSPFLVLATQNPIESEGVYPLPEAQRDRFLMKVEAGHPSMGEEMEIVRRMRLARPHAEQVLGLQELVAQFVEGLPERFHVALVAFSGNASVVVPATQDHAAVTAALERLEMGNGTAIGEAVASSLDAVAAVPGAGSEQDAAPAHVVLLSDGANTVGRPVEQAVQQARAAGVPVSTIAYGTQHGEVQLRSERIRVPVDASALAALAADTHGTAYEAASGNELDDVYADIGSAIGTTPESREISHAFAGLALVAAVGAGAAAAVWSPRSL